MTDSSAGDLYEKAYNYHQSKNYDELLKICTQINNEYPDSKEARLMLNNFPIRSNDDNTLSIQYEVADYKGVKGWLFIFSIALMWSLIITIVELPGLFQDFERLWDEMPAFTITLIAASTIEIILVLTLIIVMPKGKCRVSA